jgi:hypothetical protein
MEYRSYVESGSSLANGLGKGTASSRAAKSCLNNGLQPLREAPSAHEPFFAALFRIYDFENEFQFQLQGYPRRAEGVNPPAYNRV